MRLGKREIDALTCPPGRQDALFFDDELPGFALRVTAKGTKTFLLQYKRGGKVKRLRLGEYGKPLTPAAARRLAEEARGRLAAGDSPVDERKAEITAEAAAGLDRKRQVEAARYTLAVMLEDWVAHHLRHQRASYREEAPRTLRRVLAGLLELPAATIEPAMIGRALGKLLRQVKPPATSDAARAKSAERDVPAVPAGSRRAVLSPAVAVKGEAMSRRVRAYGHAAYGWAVKNGRLTVNPFVAVPINGREVARERHLSDAELHDTWRAAGGLGWPWADYFRVLLLTLQREKEVAGMEWGELSPDLSTWTLPSGRTKNGKAHIVHLAEPVRAILDAVPRIAGSAFVFTTTGRTPVSGFSHAKQRLDGAMAKLRAKAAVAAEEQVDPAAPWRLHDLRRTGVTALASLGVAWEVADKVLNHTGGRISGVAAIYQRHEFLHERRDALTRWAAYVLAVADGGASGNVVAMRPASMPRKP